MMVKISGKFNAETNNDVSQLQYFMKVKENLSSYNSKLIMIVVESWSSFEEIN